MDSHSDIVTYPNAQYHCDVYGINQNNSFYAENEFRSVVFCGHQPFLPLSGKPISECFANFLLVILNSLVILVLLPNLFVKWCKSRSPCDATSQSVAVNLPCHHVRWILVLIVMFVDMIATAEGLVVARVTDEMALHLFFPYLLGFAATMTMLITYSFAEKYNMPGLLFATILYWIGDLGVMLFKLVILFKDGYGMEHMRPWMALIVAGASAVFLCVDFYALSEVVSGNELLLLRLAQDWFIHAVGS